MGMNKVLKVSVPEYGVGAFILYSASKRNMEETLGDFRVTNHFSFAYVSGDYAAEWEPQYGPIQVFHKCEKDSEGSREHYIFDYDNSPGGNWSQMAVDEMELPQAASRGEWKYIFSVLKEWSERN
jgi:hypothetical protein